MFSFMPCCVLLPPKETCYGFWPGIELLDPCGFQTSGRRVCQRCSAGHWPNSVEAGDCMFLWLCIARFRFHGGRLLPAQIVKHGGHVCHPKLVTGIRRRIRAAVSFDSVGFRLSDLPAAKFCIACEGGDRLRADLAALLTASALSHWDDSDPATVGSSTPGAHHKEGPAESSPNGNRSGWQFPNFLSESRLMMPCSCREGEFGHDN